VLVVKANSALLEVKNLRKYFPIRLGTFSRAYLKAVDGVSFELREGETLGLVGESGCGKSTTGRAILRLIEPTAGEILFQGKNICQVNKKELRLTRKQMQMIYQDPYASLNPRMNVWMIVGEPLEVHRIAKGKEKEEIVRNLLEKVGLKAEHATRYPNEFSGGQRQRIGIARALALKPKLIVADEPVSALDVSIQAQVLNLLKELQMEFHLSYLFISHDLSVVEHICDRIAVMYLGKILELASDEDLYFNPLHPYTQALFSAVPVVDRTARRNRIIIRGEIPNLLFPPEGCPFHLRCGQKSNVCKAEEPVFKEAKESHFVACHLFG
jgi:oligopeptide/dipeptide ABC transporter ATP-binding protein